MTSGPSNQTFLFVNKDSTSEKLSQSGSTEHSRILSHIRSKHATSKRPWKQYTTVLHVSGDNSVKDGTKSVTSPARFNPNPEIPNVVYRNQDVQGHTDTSWLKTLKHDDTVYAYLSSCWPSFPDSASTPGDMNVMISPSSHKDSAEHHHRPEKLFVGCSATSSLPIIDFRSRDQVISKKSKARDGDELLLYSSMAHGSSTLAWRNGHVGDNHSQFWIGKTLQALRQRLTRPLASRDAGLVLSVFTLAMAALSDATPQMWADNPYVTDRTQFETCRTHLRAMLTLVENAGGWHKFDAYVLEGMLLVDKYAALFSLSAPLIPLATFDPGDKQFEFPASKVPEQDSIPDMASAYDELPIDADLKKTLREVAKFYHAAGGIWQTEVKLTPQQQSLLYCRFQAINYKLLLTRPTDPASELVRLATLVILCNATLYGAGLVFTRVTSYHLCAKMTELLASNDQLDHRIKYWCLCTGATTRLPRNDKSWFVDRFLEQITEDNSEPSLPAIRSVMKKYLYIPWLQDVQLEAIIGKKQS